MNDSFEQHARPLRERYEQAQKQNPKARIRNLAQQLSVSEMELVAAGCGGIESVLLTEPAQAVFKELGSLGRVMALTRNEWCVHERHGKYEDIRAGKAMGIVLGPDIDLRMFFSTWKHTFAVNDDGRLSIQFFDEAGTAVHKVYVTEESDLDAYHALLAKFTCPEPEWPTVVSGSVKIEETVAEAPAQLREDWLAMQDTHDFHGLLKRHKVARLTALRAAGTDLAQQVANDVVEQMLQQVVERDIAFMCFVGNSGMVQIHSGPIKKLLRTGPWFNVLEPHFNLHLDTSAIASTWVVNKPTSDGWVTSLECYTDQGELIVQFFGVRKPGVPELVSWRELLLEYCPEPLAA